MPTCESLYQAFLTAAQVAQAAWLAFLQQQSEADTANTVWLNAEMAAMMAYMAWLECESGTMAAQQMSLLILREAGTATAQRRKGRRFLAVLDELGFSAQPGVVSTNATLLDRTRDWAQARGVELATAE